jgi:predicted nuclease of predicted toxin-antitoxin system
MKIWLDAQLPPALARWFQEQPWDIKAVAVRDIGLRDASDPEIFAKARAAGAVVMTKDQDFVRLLEVQGPPPQVIWLRLGNTSTGALKEVLSKLTPRSGRHADLLEANKIGFQLGFTILQEHGNHLLQVRLKLIKALCLTMGAWKPRYIAHEQTGVGAALDHR